MGALKDREAHHEEEKKLFNCLVDLLSYEKITFNGECHIVFISVLILKKIACIEWSLLIFFFYTKFISDEEIKVEKLYIL